MKSSMIRRWLLLPCVLSFTVGCQSNSRYSKDSETTTDGSGGVSGSASDLGSGGTDSGSTGGSAGAGADGSGGDGGSAGTGRDGGVSGSGGSGGEVAGVGASGGDGGGGSGGEDTAGVGGSGGGGSASVCDPDETPSDADGYFVSPSGDDSTGAGTRAKPWQTIERALSGAQQTGRTRIYLESGTYNETLVLSDFDDGIVIEGGFEVDSGQSPAVWTRDCTDGARDLTQIVSGEPIAMIADGLPEGSGLQHLTLNAVSNGSDGNAGESGESIIALLVRGDDGQFLLDDVVVRAGDGGDGGGVSDGASGTGPLDCDTESDCGTGANGSSPADADDRADSIGNFTENGYVVLNGRSGPDGGDGDHGTPGGNGDSLSCTYACFPNSTPYCPTRTERNPGVCGCGGEAGLGGEAGRGGGASISVLVVGAAAHVSVRQSELMPGDGGDGSAGGQGGDGSDGTSGEAGAQLSCYTDCTLVDNSCNYTDFQSADGGASGGDGGRGGDGADGSGGPGGPSLALVVAGGAQADVDDQAASLLPGDGGLGGGTAPQGASLGFHDAS